MKSKKLSTYHVSVSAEAFAAAQFARLGCDVSIQYGANQPEYDLIISQGNQILKVSVKGSQDGGWGLTQSYLRNANYHEAAKLWLKKHSENTIFCLVQFQNVQEFDLPRMYIASPKEIANILKNNRNGYGTCILSERLEYKRSRLGNGAIDEIPNDWKFTKKRLNYLLKKIN